MRILLFVITLFSASLTAQETAQQLLNQYRDALFQIQIIEKESGNKSSIGSGFRIADDDLIVTNYHVIASYVYFPDKYRIIYRDISGNEGELTLFDFDVVNDLALVRFTQTPPPGPKLSLAAHLPEQGMPIFSLGNPHDLGMIVVPGTFNGLKHNSFYQRIHVTGSINPGMSGGPTVDITGQVMGVNVATAGNQIGFLVPLSKITALVSSANEPIAPAAYKAHIHQQLTNNQRALVSELLGGVWQTTQLGLSEVPGKITEFLSCWGDSNANDETATFLSVENRCRLDEQIYLHDNFRTGAVELEFEWLSSDQLGEYRFANFYSESLFGAGPGNVASEEDVTNYRCDRSRLRNRHGMTQDVQLCLRAYRDFNGLYDVLFVSASHDHDQAGLISHFTLAGVEQSLAQEFTRIFMDAVKWQ